MELHNNKLLNLIIMKNNKTTQIKMNMIAPCGSILCVHRERCQNCDTKREVVEYVTKKQ